MTGPARLALTLVSLVILIALPIAGAVAKGSQGRNYLEFPPLTRYVEHQPFSWSAFTLLACAFAAFLVPFIARMLRAQVLLYPRVGGSPVPARPFPWWGWFGLILGAAAWVLAWTRFPWFVPLQAFTFSPLWLAYIVVVNALTWKRTGRCLLRDRPGLLLTLAAVSAVFWWYFEYLNRFVQNWYYVGVESLTPMEYALFATLPFATVLPAVMSTDEWLRSYPRLTAGLDRFRPIRVTRPRRIGWLLLAGSAAGMLGIGIQPDYFFPLLWLSPLFVLTATDIVSGRPTVFAGVEAGDWRRVVRLALAALLCGFFWEMWNDRSLAKWVYAVPFVNRFHVFEMPILGYAGYLPFGLECAAIADRVATLFRDERVNNSKE
jgi:hypothetical protein